MTHFITFHGTLSKAFSMSTKHIYNFLPFFLKFLLHFFIECRIHCCFSWHKSKLHFIQTDQCSSLVPFQQFSWHVLAVSLLCMIHSITSPFLYKDRHNHTSFPLMRHSFIIQYMPQVHLHFNFNFATCNSHLHTYFRWSSCFS